MKYKCILLDHDDTAVRSSPDVHYPAFIQSMEKYRPGEYILPLQSFMNVSFYPGLMKYYRETLHFTDDELDGEGRMWHDYVMEHIPRFYDGFAEFVTRLRDTNVLFAVTTQSTAAVVRRDYAAGCGFEPELIYGYDLGEGKCKPSPYCIRDISEKYGIAPSEMLVIDDLRLGLDMATAGGADFACSGWSHFVPEIISYMKKNSPHYFSTVDELNKFIFS